MSGLGDESECVSVLSVIGLDPNINYSLVMGPVFSVAGGGDESDTGWSLTTCTYLVTYT